LLNPVEKRGLKPLIALNFYIFFDRMTSRIGCGNGQYKSNCEIGSNSWLHPCRAGMKKGSGLRR
jgi:hypothetical protein